MLYGTNVTLRQVREADLDTFYDAHVTVAARGDWYPLHVVSEPQLRRDFADSELWNEEAGILLGEVDGRVVGHAQFFRPIEFLDALEIAGLLYEPSMANLGYASEALGLLSDYLFTTRRVNRLELRIHPDHGASQHVAERHGFAHESTARGVWWHRGQHHDLQVWALLRDEWAAG